MCPQATWLTAPALRAHAPTRRRAVESACRCSPPRRIRLLIQLEPSDETGELCDVVQRHLAQDAGAMVIHGLDADGELVGDFLCRRTHRKALHDLFFPRRERGQKLLDPRAPLP